MARISRQVSRPEQAGHVDVEQNQIGALVANLLEGFVAGARFRHGVAVRGRAWCAGRGESAVRRQRSEFSRRS